MAVGMAAASAVAIIAGCRGCAGTDGDAGAGGTAGSHADAAADRKLEAGVEAAIDAIEAEDCHADVTAESDAPNELTGDAGCALSNWQPWTGWSTKRPIYVPPPGCPLPAPIEWEPCPPPVPQSIVCRRMKNTWNGSSSPFPKFWRDPATGASLLLFSRSSLDGDPDRRLRLVAEADGPVRMAHYYQNMQDLTVTYMEEVLSDGFYGLNAEISSATYSDTLQQALLGAPVDSSTPSVLLIANNPTTKFSSNFAISSSWLVQAALAGITAWPWDAKSSTAVYTTADDPNGLVPRLPVIRGAEVFVGVGDPPLCGVMSWTPQDGLRPLLRRFSDPTWAAGIFGTDGKDMVWTQSQGANACNADGANPEVWTAPYTTDPAVLKNTAHRVRSDVRGIGSYPYAVGFGFAARKDDFGSPSSVSLSIVRLSDGYRWIVSGDPTGQNGPFWGAPMGITDQELFVAAGMPDTTVARIRLDSLGPGTPPD